MKEIYLELGKEIYSHMNSNKSSVNVSFLSKFLEVEIQHCRIQNNIAKSKLFDQEEPNQVKVTDQNLAK